MSGIRFGRSRRMRLGRPHRKINQLRLRIGMDTLLQLMTVKIAPRELSVPKHRRSRPVQAMARTRRTTVTELKRRSSNDQRQDRKAGFSGVARTPVSQMRTAHLQLEGRPSVQGN